MSKNLHLVTCPTQGTLNQLIKLNIFKKKNFLLEDPILNIKEITKKRLENIPFEKGYIYKCWKVNLSKKTLNF